MRRRALSQRAMRNNYLLKAGHAHSRGGRHFILAAAAFLLPANLTLFPRRSCLSSSSTQRDSASPYSRISSSPSRGDEELQQDAERSRTSNSASGKMSDMRVGNSRARSKWSRKFLLASSSFAAAADAVPDIDAAASTGAHDEHEETAVESPSSDSNSPAETATSTSSVNSHMMCRDTSANDCREPFADDRKEGNGSHLSDEVLEATINTASPQSRWRIGRPHDMVRAVGRTVRLRLPSRGVTRWNRLWTGRGDALPRPEDETQDIRVGLPIVVATVAGGGVGGIPAGGGLTGSVGGDAADAKAVDGNIVVGTDDMDQDSGCTSTPDGASPAQPRQMLYDGEKVSTETWEKVDELRQRAERSDAKELEGRSLQLWLAGGGEGRVGLTDMDLLRFIMFRHGDVDAAWKQLKAAAVWRQENDVEGILSEERGASFKELQEEIFWLGRDVDGRPTMVLRSIAHHPGRVEGDTFQRYFLYLLEQGRQLWGVGSVQQMNIVIDRVGAGMKNQDPKLLGMMLPVFRDAYPDIIYRCYVAPTSWIFRLVWIIAARLVDERQRKRVLLLLREWQSSLLAQFDASILPPHLGGTLKKYPPRQPPNM